MISNDFLYNSGDLFLKGPIKNFLDYYWIGDDNTVFYFTNWSIMHFVSGIITAILLQTSEMNYWNGFVIHSLWEIWQIFIKKTPLETLRGRVDVIVDTILFMVGMYVFYTFQKSN
jgi:hypothetical protein